MCDAEKETEPPTTPEPTAECLSSVDKVSMELLMNNHHYVKYLSKTNPQKHDEFLAYRKTLEKYHDKIIHITSKLLNDRTYQINNIVSESFHAYTKNCIQYLENKEREEKCTKDSYSDDSQEEDEIMFDPKHMESPNDDPAAVQPFPKSFWGKQVYKSTSDTSLCRKPLFGNHKVGATDSSENTHPAANSSPPPPPPTSRKPPSRAQLSVDLRAFSGKKFRK